MNKLDTYRRISKILAIKCNKANSEKESINSFNKATEIKHQLEQIESESDLKTLINDMNIWAGNNPIATDAEVDYLMQHGK